MRIEWYIICTQCSNGDIFHDDDNDDDLNYLYMYLTILLI